MLSQVLFALTSPCKQQCVEQEFLFFSRQSLGSYILYHLIQIVLRCFCLFGWVFSLKFKDCSFVSPLYVLLTENWKLACQIFYRSGILETCMALR